MSIQRVFESARKLGVPVIMTDPAGREPLVVLSLEQFEAMAGEGHGQSSAPVTRMPEVPHPQGSPIRTSPVADIPLDIEGVGTSFEMESGEIPSPSNQTAVMLQAIL